MYSIIPLVEKRRAPSHLSGGPPQNHFSNENIEENGIGRLRYGKNGIVEGS